MVEAEASGSGKRETAELAVELAHAEKRRRQNALSELPEWLKVQEACSESACERVWQGGFYCLWHADSHSSQSQAVQSLASCALAPSRASVALTYIGVGFSTLRREWPRIDRARLDKFLSLARFLLRSLIKLCARSHWSHKRVASACRLLSKRVLLCNDKGYALGLATHITDICSEELATVAKLSSSSLHPDSELSAPAINHFVYLFTRVLSASHDARLRTRVKHEFFQTLLDYRWSGAESEGDPPAGPMRQLELGEIASLLTDIGGDRDVHAPNRRDLYEVSRLFSKAMERVSIVRGGEYKHTDNAGRIVTQLSEPRYELPHNVQINKAPGSEPIMWPTKRNPFANEIVPDAGAGEKRRKREKRKRKRNKKKAQHSTDDEAPSEAVANGVSDPNNEDDNDKDEQQREKRWKSARQVRTSHELEGSSDHEKRVKWGLEHNKMWAPKKNPSDSVNRGISKLSESPAKSCLKSSRISTRPCEQ